MEAGSLMALVKMLKVFEGGVCWLREKRLTDLELPKMLILGWSCLC